MYPEDRVLVAFVPHPRDFQRIAEERWYRIPVRFAPKGLYAEYIAFYFGRGFADKKWAIHYYTSNLGHELTTRRALLPEEADHERADELYYKVQLGPLKQLTEPIPSLRWRRIAFIHTTWDRFQDASEINDLFLDGDPYVDRVYATLKERGLRAERNYQIKEPNAEYIVPLAVPCLHGIIKIGREIVPQNDRELLSLIDTIIVGAADRGGIL